MRRVRYWLATLLLCSTVLGAAPFVSAASRAQQDACAGLSQLDATAGCGTKADAGITKLVTVIVDILSLIVGIIAVIMIIVGGLKYITSSGDANNVSSAKNTLIYALIGIVIVVLAQAIVRFVVNRTAPQAKTTSYSAPSIIVASNIGYSYK